MIFEDAVTHVVFVRDVAVLFPEPEVRVITGDTDMPILVAHDITTFVAPEVTTTHHILTAPSTIAVEGGAPVEGPYVERVDFVGDTVAYRGWAAPGTADDAPLWRLKRITISAGPDVVEHWAGGVADFTYRWTDRLSLAYS